MKKYQLNEKYQALLSLCQEIYQASEKNHPNALEYDLPEWAEQNLKKASQKIEKAVDLIEEVYQNLDCFSKR